MKDYELTIHWPSSDDNLAPWVPNHPKHRVVSDEERKIETKVITYMKHAALPFEIQKHLFEYCMAFRSPVSPTADAFSSVPLYAFTLRALQYPHQITHHAHTWQLTPSELRSMTYGSDAFIVRTGHPPAEHNRVIHNERMNILVEKTEFPPMEERRGLNRLPGGRRPVSKAKF